VGGILLEVPYSVCQLLNPRGGVMSHMPIDVDIKKIHRVIKTDHDISLSCGNKIYLRYLASAHAPRWIVLYEKRWLKYIHFPYNQPEVECVKDPNEGRDMWFRLHFQNRGILDEMCRVEREINNVMWEIEKEPWDENKETWWEFKARRLKETIMGIKEAKMNDTPRDISREEMLGWLKELKHEYRTSPYIDAWSHRDEVMFQAIRADIEGRDKDFTPCVCPDFDKKKGCVTPGDECNRLEPF